MEEDSVVSLPKPEASVTDDPLLAVQREDARRMLMQAVEAEVEGFSPPMPGWSTSRTGAGWCATGMRPSGSSRPGLVPSRSAGRSCATAVSPVKCRSGSPRQFCQPIFDARRTSRSSPLAVPEGRIDESVRRGPGGATRPRRARAVAGLMLPSAVGTRAAASCYQKKSARQSYSNMRGPRLWAGEAAASSAPRAGDGTCLERAFRSGPDLLGSRQYPLTPRRLRCRSGIRPRSSRCHSTTESLRAIYGIAVDPVRLHELYGAPHQSMVASEAYRDWLVVATRNKGGPDGREEACDFA